MIPDVRRRAWLFVLGSLSCLPAVQAGAEGLNLRLAPALSVPLTMPAPAAGPAARATSWSDLLEAASSQAAVNRAADAGFEAAQAQSEGLWASAWMPRLDASAAANRQQQSYNGVEVRTPASSMTLTATLPLWRAADRAAARAQAATAEQAEWQARTSRAAVAREVSRAYLGAVETAEQVRLTQAQQAVLAELVQINERRLQGGLGTVLDILETRIRLDQTRASIQDLLTRLGTQRLTLERLTGRPVVLPSGLASVGIALPQVVPPRDQAVALVNERNPQLHEAHAQVQAAQAITEARSGESWQPTVDGVAQAGRSRQVQQFEGATDKQNISTRSVGVQVNWPLYTGGYHRQREKEATALLVQAEARRDDTRTQVDTSLSDAYQTLAQLNQVIAVQREVEQSALATTEALRKAFSAGLRSNLDLLNAQQQVHAARQSLVTARVGALNAQVDILALINQLDAPSTAPLMAVVDTTAWSQVP
ncbi:MAG: hypothetical protein EOP38_09415 [Rubrivivax sp.]|nr:MAG: hypothetical protein EOP38_09415 [Rubrivivax sp.]